MVQSNGLQLEKKGLELSQEYYETIGRPVLENYFLLIWIRSPWAWWAKVPSALDMTI